jgi:tetratricopeptide (TPR) repeat protein
MRSKCHPRWLLFACLCVPFHLSAQTQPSRNSVSVRELRIPYKALHAFEQGMASLAKKDPAGSLPHFQRAVSEYEGYYEAYDRIGAAYLKLSRYQEAEQAFRKSIDVSGGQYAHPLLALGAILDQREQFTDAESVIRKGLALAPDSWTGHYYLALAEYGLNRVVESEQSVYEALHWKADFPEAYLLLAEIHSRKEDYRALVSDLNEYLRLAPNGPASAGVKTLRESAQAMIRGSSSNASLAQP